MSKEKQYYWSERDLKKLRKYCDNVQVLDFDRLLKMFPGRTKKAIYQTINRHNIFRKYNWGCYDDYLLRKLHDEGLSYDEIEKHFPERTRAAIQQRSIFLGIRKSKKWTCRDIETIKGLAKFYSVKEIAEKYKVSYSDISGIFRRYNIEKLRKGRADKQRLSHSQVKEIRTRWQKGERQVDLAKEFGVSNCAMHHIVTRKSYKHIK